ncbi:hypothetical protein P43SY_008902 [Pythium insidiosum]|uniref:Uncharacterized protein n=1 Tax=Pythium insidiosum TaxID=114742 RepID=A0AAD5LCX8_PYTIN|nr:hypothetical protein P43SY_008902 [Pythium insidiosum]
MCDSDHLQANGIKSKVDAAWKDIVATSNNHFEQLMDAKSETQTQITNSTNAIIADNKEGVRRMGEIYASACVTAQVKDKEFAQAKGQYNTMMKEAQTDSSGLHDDILALIEKVEKALSTAKGKKWWQLIADGIGGVGADLVYMGSAEDRLKEAARRLEHAIANFVRVMRELSGMASGNREDWEDVRRHLHNKPRPGDGVPPHRPQSVAPPYDKYFTKLRDSDVTSVFAGLNEVMAITCDVLMVDVKSGVTSANVKQINDALGMCYRISDDLGGVHDRLREAMQYLERMRAMLAEKVTADKQCRAAKAVSRFTSKATGSGRGRRELQQAADADLDANAPFYAMHYTALTRLLLDYRLQEAGYQFCKFYEFRNGGVAPPMCGSGAYYSLEQILLMRAWRPPVYKRSNVRALLPTKRTMDPQTGRSYPFVSLEALAAGKPVTFELPLWDIAWLKRYGWLSKATRPEDVPSIYVDTFRIFLPIHGNVTSEDVGGGGGLAAAVTVEAAGPQYLKPQDSTAGRVFELPSQVFKFDASYGDSMCPDENLLRNPYHEAALCVQPDGASDVCFRDAGRTPTQDENGLLPSLFSSWRLRAKLEKGDGSLSLVAPSRLIRVDKSEPSGLPEFNLIADLSVVLVRASSSSRAESSDAARADERSQGTCCGPNAYRASRAQCLPCPAGSNATLYGYSCI